MPREGSQILRGGRHGIGDLAGRFALGHRDVALRSDEARARALEVAAGNHLNGADRDAVGSHADSLRDAVREGGLREGGRGELLRVRHGELQRACERGGRSWSWRGRRWSGRRRRRNRRWGGRRPGRRRGRRPGPRRRRGALRRGGRGGGGTGRAGARRSEAALRPPLLLRFLANHGRAAPVDLLQRLLAGGADAVECGRRRGVPHLWAVCLHIAVELHLPDPEVFPPVGIHG
mmetsp:Transcript_108439/g.339252  ORF Transcript_108439/g.339252 Transcript_108439/m.339252 type:complete len:233 (+) Transcript_108439:418-1116(+)